MTPNPNKRLVSFPPIVDAGASVLILGSMPGKVSLAARQYYAHPQNSFWRIMRELVDLDPAASYTERLDGLRSAGIALWDVLHSCQRKGSLDSAIRNAKPNDFAAFFNRHPGIQLVCFNGATAERCYLQLVLPTLAEPSPRRVLLPSSSPAHASMSFQHKVARWRTAMTLGTRAVNATLVNPWN
jgi:double-stranded uracil-DNA glycosylase